MNYRILCWVVSLFVLCGCQYPMGLSKEQWTALTPQQQAEYQAQQNAIDEQRRRESEARHERELVAAAERARLEREQLEMAYAHARYRDIISVTVQGGYISFAGKAYLYEPLTFDILRGERKWVEFSQLGRHQNRQAVQVGLTEDGNTFYFDETAKDRLILVSEKWDEGRLYTPLRILDRHSQSQASGISIAIRYKELPGAPRRVIIEQRPRPVKK